MKSVLSFLLLLSTLHTFSQDVSGRVISGQVLCAETSSPIEGVTVAVKGSAKVSGTQADGVYYISVGEADSILVFTLDRFRSQEIKISTSSQIDVKLERAGIAVSSEEPANNSLETGKPLVVEGHIYFEKTSAPANRVHIYIIEGEEEALTDKNGYFRIETWQKLPLQVTVKHYQQPPLRYRIADPNVKQVLWIK